MLRRFFGRVGIDLPQLRALVVVGIRLDLRVRGAVEGRSSGVQRLLAMGVMNLVLGLALGAIALWVPDVFLSGSLVLTVTMFLVAVSIVMEFAVVVISPLDYEVLGCQPISGATYLAARIANILFYTVLITTTLAVLPMAAFFFARGFSPAIGLAGVIAIYLGCLTTTLAMVALYVATARLVHPQRLRRVLTYVQLVASFSIYGAYFLLPEVFRPHVLAGWTVRKTWVMLLYPPTWFASYLEIAAGQWTPLEVVPAAASLVALGGLTILVAGRLSLDYSETLSRQAAASTPASPARASSSLRSKFSTGERRAVALLIRAQFRHDQRFRLGVLAMVPLSVFYLLMSVKDGQLGDPFVTSRPNGAMLVYFAVLFIPMMLLMAVSRSDAYRASWIFHATPARRGALVMAAKDFTVAYLLVPYLLMLALVLSYFFGSILHAFAHVLVEGLIANLLLLLMVALQPNLPFSQPVQKGQFTAGFVVVVLVGSIVQPLSTIFLSTLVYPHPVAIVAVVVILVGGALGGQTLLRRRLDRVTASLEFVD